VLSTVWPRQRRRGDVFAVLLGAGIGLLSWQNGPLTPRSGLDGSWQAALYLAAERHIQFGPDIDFTYGPLGFLAIPVLYDPLLGPLAWALDGAIHLALCVVIALEARHAARHWPVVILLTAAGGIATTLLSPLLALTCLAVWVAVRSLSASGRSPWAELGIAVAFGLMAGALFLVKLNDGFTIVLIGGATAVGLTRPVVTVPTFVAATAAGLVGGWLLSNQQLVDLPVFLSRATEIATGYSSAMSLPGRGPRWWLALAIATILLGDAIRRTTIDWRPVARAALALGIAGVWFADFRSGFVRHTPGPLFAILFIICGWLLAWRPVDRHRRIVAGAVLGAIALAAGQLEHVQFNAIERVSAAVDQLTTIVDADRRDATIIGARSALQAEYDIPTRMVAMIGTGSVHVAAVEAGVMWAYPNLRWSPLPVFQQYLAYTEDLDSLDADRLSSSSGPEFVLRGVPAPIDQRSDWYEAPKSAAALVCHYELAMASERWQLLRRSADRCSGVTFLGAVSVRPGGAFAVPAPARVDQVVLAHIHGVGVDTWSRLQTLLGEPAVWTIASDGAWQYRLIPGTAGGPLIVARSTDLGYADPFQPPASAAQLLITVGDWVGQPYTPQPNVKLEIEFEAMDVASTADHD
jgi:hypothetical protein